MTRASTISAGTLFVVSTPIGNLHDITLRAIEVLRRVHVIATEDPRVTASLLKRFGITGTLTTYNHETWPDKVPILVQCLQRGQSVALVCDGGTPTVFDPGSALVERSVELGFPVTALPGPSAPLAALALSGFSGDCFSFLGKIPGAYRAMVRLFSLWRMSPHTLICFPTDGALSITLRAMQDALGPRRVVIGINLTEPGELAHRGAIRTLMARDWSIARRQKVTIVIEGCRPQRREGRRLRR
jgi:16S rRNA (cytidine1402-2'-O)-methyltransferase